MKELEVWVQNTARGVYRWERSNLRKGWKEEKYNFEEGDAIAIDVFDGDVESEILWPVYGEFVQYETDDIARVYIPPEGEDRDKCWFTHDEGEYLIHEGYLIPQ